MAVIVVYGGGFQPFHAGHLSSYIEAKEAFPNADFYVAASNDTKTRPIPFNDKKFLAQQAGVTDRFVEVKLPIRPSEIIDRYNPKKDIFILVRSERDPVAYTKKDGSPGYYQPYESLDKCQPFGYHGYVFVTHKKEFKLNGQDVYSGTQVRDMYTNSDNNGRINIIKQLYPESSQQDTIKQMLDKYLGSNTEPVVTPAKSAIKKLKDKPLAENLTNLINNVRPLIKEATPEQKIKMLKLMKEAISFKINRNKINPEQEKPKNDDSNLGYDYLFKQKEEPKPQPKVYHGWEEYEKDKEVDEAKIHFTDPNAKVNLYYITPKLEAQGQVQNVAHNIPYSTVQPLIDRLLQKYPNMNPEYIVWYPLGQDKYGKRIEENQDYLEEK